jgi:aryl-alcohol dehydrogenase-like predicted oxidoreductase
MSFGDRRALPWVIEEDEALPLLKAAYDRGLNTWDTANVYSNGVSEVIVGKAIKKYNIPREKVIILTKCFWAVGEDPESRHFVNTEAFEASKDYQNAYGLSRAAIFNQVEASLKRLDTDYIDLLQIHRFDRSTPIEETMLLCMIWWSAERSGILALAACGPRSLRACSSVLSVMAGQSLLACRTNTTFSTARRSGR